MICEILDHVDLVVGVFDAAMQEACLTGVPLGECVYRSCQRDRSRSRYSRPDGCRRVGSVQRACVVQGPTQPTGVCIKSRVRRRKGRSQRAAVFLGLCRWLVWMGGTLSTV